MSLSAQQPWARWPCSGAPGSDFLSMSSCQPQEERRKHHLSAGADSVGDCAGLPRRFKWKWSELPARAPAQEGVLSRQRGGPGRGEGQKEAVTSLLRGQPQAESRREGRQRLCVCVCVLGGYVCAPDSVISQTVGAGFFCKKSP